jgi:hypothetical protein
MSVKAPPSANAAALRGDLGPSARWAAIKYEEARYARWRGWRVSCAQLSFTAFATGRDRDGPDLLWDLVRQDCPGPGRLLDHINRWRIGRRVIAFTVQPYNFDAEGLAILQAWGARHRLQVTVPRDFPSWHCPGSTTLIEIRRAAP